MSHRLADSQSVDNDCARSFNAQLFRDGCPRLNNESNSQHVSEEGESAFVCVLCFFVGLMIILFTLYRG